MSTHPESSDRSATTSPADVANLGAQLSEALNKFNELSRQMAIQRHMIDQLVTGSNNGVQSKPLPASQPTYSYPYPYNPCPVYQTTINHPRPQPNYTNPSILPVPIFKSNLQTRLRPPYNPNPTQPNNRTYPLNRKIRNPTLYRLFTNLG